MLLYYCVLGERGSVCRVLCLGREVRRGRVLFVGREVWIYRVFCVGSVDS